MCQRNFYILQARSGLVAEGVCVGCCGSWFAWFAWAAIGGHGPREPQDHGTCKPVCRCGNQSASIAQLYNQNLIKYVTSNKGTPLRPDTFVDAYIFAIFNENMKPGPGSERFFGLFNPDKLLVYNLSIITTTSPPGGLDAPPPFTSPATPAPPIVVYPPPSMPVYPLPLPTPPAMTLPPPATIYPLPIPVPSPMP